MANQTGLRSLPRNIWVVTATSFLTDISSDMIFNLIPLFLANVLGVGTAVIGLIDGIAETTASLTKVYAGALSDQLGQRKWLAVIGYGLSAVSKPFLFFANAWGWVLGVRFADRIGKGVRTAPRDALVSDSINEKRTRLRWSRCTGSPPKTRCCRCPDATRTSRTPTPLPPAWSPSRRAPRFR